MWGRILDQYQQFLFSTEISKFQLGEVEKRILIELVYVGSYQPKEAISIQSIPLSCFAMLISALLKHFLKCPYSEMTIMVVTRG